MGRMLGFFLIVWHTPPREFPNGFGQSDVTVAPRHFLVIRGNAR